MTCVVNPVQCSYRLVALCWSVGFFMHDAIVVTDLLLCWSVGFFMHDAIVVTELLVCWFLHA